MKDENKAPEGLNEITLDQFQRGVFSFDLQEKQQRKVENAHDNFGYDLLLFPIKHELTDKELGFAIKRISWNAILKRTMIAPTIGFCRYGKDKDWKELVNNIQKQKKG